MGFKSKWWEALWSEHEGVRPLGHRGPMRAILEDCRHSF